MKLKPGPDSGPVIGHAYLWLLVVRFFLAVDFFALRPAVVFFAAVFLTVFPFVFLTAFFAGFAAFFFVAVRALAMTWFPSIVNN